MTNLRPNVRFAIALASSLTVAGTTLVAQQDTLARAKNYYASAAYEEALQVLDGLHGKAAPPEVTEVAAYQVFCLVALGRNDEARHAIEGIVRVDPLYHPSEAQVSPRVRAFFENVRRPLLPAIVKQSYGKAREAFDRKEMTAASAGFDRVIAVIDEMDAPEDQAIADLRTLAGGFRDLCKAATPVSKPAPPPGPPAPTESASGAGDPAAADAPAPSVPAKPMPTYGAADLDVTEPVALSQGLPPWSPINDVVREYRGSVELLVSEDGKVLSALLVKSVHPTYDRALLRAAQDWKYRPAMKDGVPVRYRLRVDIRLTR